MLAKSSMCAEVAMMSDDELRSIDPMSFLIYHRSALLEEFVQQYIDGVENAKEGKPASINGFSVEPADMIGPALDALLTVIVTEYCFESVQID